ncbi:hypothetical protein HDK64DRAFT_263901 [Phyllosticta capitalensis]
MEALTQYCVVPHAHPRTFPSRRQFHPKSPLLLLLLLLFPHFSPAMSGRPPRPQSARLPLTSHHVSPSPELTFPPSSQPRPPTSEPGASSPQRLAPGTRPT